MAVMVTRTSDTAEDLAAMAGASVLDTLTIPGQPEHVREARSFVADVLSDLGTETDTAVLLTSELVTNAVRHSNSCAAGGTVTLVILAVADGVRIEVVDEGSELSSPVVKGDIFASDGHGLFLVESLAGRWGYVRAEARTIVWFQLNAAMPPRGTAKRAGRAGQRDGSAQRPP